jgi:cobalamin biosynthesis protein CbiD
MFGLSTIAAMNAAKQAKIRQEEREQVALRSAKRKPIYSVQHEEQFPTYVVNTTKGVNNDDYDVVFGKKIPANVRKELARLCVDYLEGHR